MTRHRSSSSRGHGIPPPEAIRRPSAIRGFSLSDRTGVARVFTGFSFVAFAARGWCGFPDKPVWAVGSWRRRPRLPSDVRRRNHPAAGRVPRRRDKSADVPTPRMEGLLRPRRSMRRRHDVWSVIWNPLSAWRPRVARRISNDTMGASGLASVADFTCSVTVGLPHMAPSSQQRAPEAASCG